MDRLAGTGLWKDFQGFQNLKNGTGGPKIEIFTREMTPIYLIFDFEGGGNSVIFGSDDPQKSLSFTAKL